jgi:hypothetical protein
MSLVFDGPIFFDDRFNGESPFPTRLGNPNARARVRLFRTHDDRPTVALASDVVHLSAAWLITQAGLMAAIVDRPDVDPDTTIIIEHHRSPIIDDDPASESFARYREGLCGTSTQEMSRACVENLTGCPISPEIDAPDPEPISLELRRASENEMVMVPYRTVEGRRRFPTHRSRSVEDGAIVQALVGSLRHLSSYRTPPSFMRLHPSWKVIASAPASFSI